MGAAVAQPTTEWGMLVKAAMADLGATPGALADWLDERDDPRGVLLRRRWKRWRREEAEYQAAIKSFEVECFADIEKMTAAIGDVSTIRYTLGDVTVLKRPGKPPQVLSSTTTPTGSFRRYIRERFFKGPEHERWRRRQKAAH